MNPDDWNETFFEELISISDNIHASNQPLKNITPHAFVRVDCDKGHATFTKAKDVEANLLNNGLLFQCETCNKKQVTNDLLFQCFLDCDKDESQPKFSIFCFFFLLFICLAFIFYL